MFSDQSNWGRSFCGKPKLQDFIDQFEAVNKRLSESWTQRNPKLAKQGERERNNEAIEFSKETFAAQNVDYVEHTKSEPIFEETEDTVIQLEKDGQPNYDDPY